MRLPVGRQTPRGCVGSCGARPRRDRRLRGEARFQPGQWDTPSTAYRRQHEGFCLVRSHLWQPHRRHHRRRHGRPGEGKTWQQIEEAHGWVEDFQGVGTDDTVIKHILCEAIIAHDGEITADEFAASFINNKDKIRYWFIPVRNMFHKVESGLELPVYAGLGNMQSSSSAMSISPMGLINACNPRQAALETYDVAGLIHAGCSTFCRDAACAMAAAVAEALRPGATVESVLGASTKYLHEKSSQVMLEAIETGLAHGAQGRRLQGLP